MLNPFNQNSNHHLFYEILSYLWDCGQECSPRGLRCKELTNFSYTLPGRVRFMCFDHRGLKMDYVKQELLWYLRGDKSDVSILRNAKMWEGLVNEDGSINSNYGQYIFHLPGDLYGSQSNFFRVVHTLIKDRDSRRAAICILNNAHLDSDTKDYPCTCYLNFHIRDDQLHMYVRMRSQDAIFGMGNDAPCFSFIHELMWQVMRKQDGFETLRLGNYHHMADSFHVYERHYEMMEKILMDPHVTYDYHEDCPEFTTAAWHDLTGILHGNPPKTAFEPFTRWILRRNNAATLNLKRETIDDYRRTLPGA